MGYDGWKPWGTAVNDADRPVRNPHVVLREEFDDWAVLFDPDTGRGFGLSPTGVYVWKLLNGEHTTDDLLKELRSYADDVPKEALEHVGAFIDELAAEGLAGFGSTGSGLPASVKRPESFPSPPSGRVCELKSFKYEPPKLIDLSGGRHEAYGDSCSPGSFASNNCYPTGNSAGGICFPGTSASYCYANGTAPGHANCLSGGSTIAECNYGTGASGYCDTGSGT
ncbi:MAG TPA: SynChlorMet cassette protein ScmD [Syntrophorhabdales bacterium]|nr:SynChlorMet cassette protein ScmD [Syntrophorhabdales bacterium]